MTTLVARRVARLLFAPSLVVAVAIVVKGYSGVGDGFAAGAVAALGIVAQGVAGDRHELERMPVVRAAPWLTMAGLGLALAVAFVPPILGQPLLDHWPGPDQDAVKLGTLEVGTPFVFDIGVFLLVVGAVGGMVRTIAHRPEEEHEL